MKKIISVILVILVLNSCSFAQNNDFPFADKKDHKFKALKDSNFSEIISLSIDWFKNIQISDGSFLYQTNAESNIASDSQNYVRQAGSFYALTEVYKRDLDNFYDLDNTIRSFAEFFKEKSISGRYNGLNFYCILDEKNECILGQTALFLSGLVNYSMRNTSFYSEYEKYIEGYKNFILAMRIPEAGFISSFEDGKVLDKEESAFFNGEAFLALALYYRYLNDKNVLEEIVSVWPYFRDLYGKNFDGNFYLWGMLALKELYYVVDMKEIVDFTALYSRSRVKKYSRLKDSSDSMCPFLEGISAANFILKDEETEFAETFRHEFEFWLQKNSLFQIKGDEFYDFKIKNLRNSKGGFVSAMDDPTLRIDNTQHCLNAFLIKYVDLEGQSLP
ncbi:MAG: hypothetical protein RBS56_03545 [Candidatus Gracilibacteria bacterium]|jgi:hypothetical protein|nr:hypothetical protein [Candidatus Gracilibacteria bacterium]